MTTRDRFELAESQIREVNTWGEFEAAIRNSNLEGWAFRGSSDVLLQLLFRDEVGRFVVELSQEPNLSDIGLLSPLALATELQSGDHLLAQWCHDMPPLVR